MSLNDARVSLPTAHTVPLIRLLLPRYVTLLAQTRMPADGCAMLMKITSNSSSVYGDPIGGTDFFSSRKVGNSNAGSEKFLASISISSTPNAGSTTDAFETGFIPPVVIGVPSEMLLVLL